jgi:ABC-type transporter MlaC component
VNLRLVVTILVIVAAPICAQAQKPTPAKVTKADAQKVLKIISSDKAKTRIYCQMAKLNPKSIRRLVRPWMPSIICVGGNARSGFYSPRKALGNGANDKLTGKFY